MFAKHESTAFNERISPAGPSSYESLLQFSSIDECNQPVDDRLNFGFVIPQFRNGQSAQFIRQDQPVRRLVHIEVWSPNSFSVGRYQTVAMRMSSGRFRRDFLASCLMTALTLEPVL